MGLSCGNSGRNPLRATSQIFLARLRVPYQNTEYRFDAGVPAFFWGAWLRGRMPNPLNLSVSAGVGSISGSLWGARYGWRPFYLRGRKCA